MIVSSFPYAYQIQSKDQTKLQSQTVDALLFFKDIDGQQFQKMQKILSKSHRHNAATRSGLSLG